MMGPMNVVALLLAAHLPRGGAFAQSQVDRSSPSEETHSPSSHGGLCHSGLCEALRARARDRENELGREVIGRSRRAVLGVSFFATTTTAAAGFLLSANPREARAVYNPLNLKGSYWETGRLYEKTPASSDLPSDPDELLASVREMASSFESLSSVVEEGKLDEASRLVRGKGGIISESRLRITGNALVDSILDDDRGYVVAEKFRVFLLNFDALDASVAAAARRSSADGGLVSTLALSAVAPLSAANRVAKIASGEPRMGSDPRLEVLGALEAAVKSLRAFAKAAEEALADQK